MVRIKCEVCGEYGYLQQLKNYFRVRHYDAQAKAKGKYAFYYHKQTQAYAESQLKNIKAIDLNKLQQLKNLEHKSTTSVQGVQENKLETSSKSSGCSLVWLGHQPATLTTRVQIPATAPNNIFIC
jgi:hypothetical protein